MCEKFVFFPLLRKNLFLCVLSIFFVFTNKFNDIKYDAIKKVPSFFFVIVKHT